MISELVRPDHRCNWIREGKAETEGGVSWKTVCVWGTDNGVRDAERGPRYREYPVRYWQTVSQQIIGNANGTDRPVIVR